MTFSDFKTLADALVALQVGGAIQEFIQPVSHTPEPSLRQRLDFVRRVGYTHSEGAVAEGLIFPVLLDVWAHYLDVVKVWNRRTFGTEDLSGSPDYVVTRISIPGQLLFVPPYISIVEAKQEKFEEGWGQCLAAMVAAQRLNRPAEPAIYGIVTTGRLWEFGRLVGRIFVQDPQTFALDDLDRTCGAIRYLFEQVKQYDVPPALPGPWEPSTPPAVSTVQ